MAKNRKEYLVVDLEMTCEKEKPKNYKPEIIEIGFVRMNFRGDILGKEQILVKPKYNEITEYCTELTGHTEDNLKAEGVYFEVACKKIIKMGFKNKIFVSWGQDWKQFELECKWKNIAFPLSEHLLDLSLFHSILLKTKEKVSLEEAIKFWNINQKGRLHSGADDAYNTALILKKIIEKFPEY